MVVLNHVYQTVTNDGGVRRHIFFLGYGNFAVAVFILVSGYSLTVAASRRPRSEPFPSFIRRRAWRIVPPYLAALVLSIMFALTVVGARTGTPWDMVLPLSWSGVAVHALLLQDVLVARPPNHVFWSIAVEWHLYFLFLPLLALRRRTSASWLFVVAAVVCALLWLRYDGKPYMGFPPQFFGLFVLGIVAGRVTVDRIGRSPRHRESALPWWSLSAVILAAPLAILLVQVDRSFFTAELTLGVAFAAFVVVLADASAVHPVRRLLEWRPLAWVGLFSYSLYLTHAPVLQVVWQHGVRPLHLGANAELLTTLVAATTVSLSVAYLFHLLFERPFMRYRSLRGLLRFSRARTPKGAGSLIVRGAARPQGAVRLNVSGTNGAASALLNALDDADARVRQAATEALADELAARRPCEVGTGPATADSTSTASRLATDVSAADPAMRVRAVEMLSALAPGTGARTQRP